MKTTLEQFHDEFEQLDGYYAVYMNIEKQLTDSQVKALDLCSSSVQCINTGTAYYSVQNGWSKYPEWFEDAKDEEVNIMLMFELSFFVAPPNLESF